jgi:hypothetical protein
VTRARTVAGWSRRPRLSLGEQEFKNLLHASLTVRGMLDIAEALKATRAVDTVVTVLLGLPAWEAGKRHSRFARVSDGPRGQQA